MGAKLSSLKQPYAEVAQVVERKCSDQADWVRIQDLTLSDGVNEFLLGARHPLINIGDFYPPSSFLSL